jgi:hypothetical protein
LLVESNRKRLGIEIDPQETPLKFTANGAEGQIILLINVTMRQFAIDARNLVILRVNAGLIKNVTIVVRQATLHVSVALVVNKGALDKPRTAKTMVNDQTKDSHNVDSRTNSVDSHQHAKISVLLLNVVLLLVVPLSHRNGNRTALSRRDSHHDNSHRSNANKRCNVKIRIDEDTHKETETKDNNKVLGNVRVPIPEYVSNVVSQDI